MFINIGAMALDALWFLMVLFIWNSSASHDEFVWDSLSGIHNFSLFLSFVNIAIRGGVIWMLRMISAEEEKNFPPMASPTKPTIVVNPASGH